MVLFKTCRKNNGEKTSLSINNEIISEKPHTKYLGMILDSKLSWTQHIHYVNLKLSKGKLRHLLTKQMLRSLYFTFVQPHIDYGLINWCCANKTSLDSVRKNIKRQ